MSNGDKIKIKGPSLLSLKSQATLAIFTNN